MRKSYSLLENFLTTQETRGYHLYEQPTPIESLYTILGRPEHGRRVEKLYKVFKSLALAKRDGNFAQIFICIMQTFSFPLKAISNETALSFFKEMKVEQLMKDMGTVQTDTYDFEESMSYVMSKQDPVWAGRPKQVYLAERIPIVIAANNIIMELEEAVMILTGPPDSPEFQEFIFNESMGKYKLSRHTFGMKQEVLSNRDLSRMTKPLINITKVFCSDLTKEIAIIPL